MNKTLQVRAGRLAAIAATTALVAAGCSGDDANDQGDDVAEELAEELADQGEVVDDVEIVFEDSSDSISVGGLEVSVPAMAGYVSDDTDTLAPPTWSTLNVLSIEHETEPFDQTGITWVVFSQTVAVTDDDLRSANAEQHWLLTELTDVEPSHRSTVEGDGVTCRVEIRVEQSDSFGDLDHGHVFFSGPGLASSAMVVAGTPTNPSVGSTVGDAVESACGTRPTGL